MPEHKPHKQSETVTLTFAQLVDFWSARLYEAETLGDGLRTIDGLMHNLFTQAVESGHCRAGIGAFALINSTLLRLFSQAADRKDLPAWYTFRKELIELMRAALTLSEAKRSNAQEKHGI